MSEAATPIAPVRKTVHVSAPASRAYELFTRDFGMWWPLSTHSVGLETSRGVSFGAAVGDDIIETTEDGTTEVWGTIRELDPPRRLSFSWHAGRSAEAVTNVEVIFTPDAHGGTDVELVHSGWEAWKDGATQSVGYQDGWTPVLQAFVDEVHRQG